MAMALKEAAKGRGHTLPNPMVGCLVVGKNREVIARGYHRHVGAAHAEIVALKRAGPRAKGATMYVNLEPCCHQGRTGPCTKAIIRAGIKRIYIGARDSNPLVNGRGLRALRRAGVEVELGLLADEAKRLNVAFEHAMKTGRPRVIAKIAQSLDGCVATRTGQSKWITSQEARKKGHAMRADVSAILVGVGTVMADDPRLTSREHGREPMRVILDTQARTPNKSRVVRLGKRSKSPTVIFVSSTAPAARRNALEKAGAQTIMCRLRGGRVDIGRVLEILGELEVRSLLVEGGPTVLGAFADTQRIDELHAFISPKVIGGVDALGAIGGRGAKHLTDSIALADVQSEWLGPDMHVWGRVKARR